MTCPECPECGETGIHRDWTPSGFVDRCSSCEAVLPSLRVPVPSNPDQLRGYVSPRLLNRQQMPEPIAKTPTAAKSVRSPAPALTPATMLRLAKQRHRELKREIARDTKALAAKQREFSNISNVLDAAEAPKPRAVVRPIRTTA